MGHVTHAAHMHILYDATLAPLSILSTGNMQIKAAINEIPFFGHSSLQA